MRSPQYASLFCRADSQSRFTKSANAPGDHEVILLLTSDFLLLTSYFPFWSIPTLDNRSASWFFSLGTCSNLTLPICITSIRAW